MTDYPLMGAVRVMLFKFCRSHIYGIGEARHFNFCVLRVLVHASYITLKGKCNVSRDLLNTNTLIRNRMWPIEWHHCQCP